MQCPCRLNERRNAAFKPNAKHISFAWLDHIQNRCIAAFPPGGGGVLPLFAKNSRDDREFLSLEMTKKKKDTDIPLLEGQRSLVGLLSPPAKRVPVTESVLPASLDGGC